jgi:hypothetical protein
MTASSHVHDQPEASHPVSVEVELGSRLSRIHVLVRVALVAAFGTIGCSSLYWLLYLALPAAATLLILQRGGERYAREVGPWVVRVLRWLAGAYAYLWLLTDALPTTKPGEGAVRLEIEPGYVPAPASALSRIISSLPALVLLAVLSVVAVVLWLVGAVVVLVKERMPPAIAGFLALTVRFQFRLAAYHLSLSDRYPSLDAALASGSR